ncbi:MAG: Dabb family protein [Rhodobacteraceae bacterium]|nr:Dabb family protein [Paracoccaceae bacterium]
MIRHIVLIRFRPEISDSTIFAIFDEIAAIKAHIPGVIDIRSGKSQSPEQIERGYMHGFTVDFESWEALQAYQDHPDHKAAGAKLVAGAVGGIDGILVVDFEV